MNSNWDFVEMFKAVGEPWLLISILSIATYVNEQWEKNSRQIGPQKIAFFHHNLDEKFNRGQSRPGGMTPSVTPSVSREKIPKSLNFQLLWIFSPVLLFKFLSTQPSNWAEREHNPTGARHWSPAGHVVSKWPQARVPTFSLLIPTASNFHFFFSCPIFRLFPNELTHFEWHVQSTLIRLDFFSII